MTTDKSATGRTSGHKNGTSTRSKARKRALDILFEAELRGSDSLATLEERTVDADPPVRDYTKTLVEGVHAHAAMIDSRISDCLATGWSLPRTPRVDRSALRIAVFEIDYSDLPDAVAVAEAVHLVSELSTDDSASFVNGVLGSVIATKPSPPPVASEPIAFQPVAPEPGPEPVAAERSQDLSSS